MADIEQTLRRVPPQSIDAEESVLGGILLDNTAIDRMLDGIIEHKYFGFDDVPNSLFG